MRRIAALALGVIGAGLISTGAYAASTTYTATLNGASEVPPTTSAGTGQATVMYDSATKMASWSVTYSGLTGPAAAAHIHCGAATGANGPVAVPFKAPPTSPITGSGEMTAAQAADLAAGKCYVNVHTAANKGGEIRGQLMAK